MNVDQVIAGIGSAVASAQSQNICVYWCMTKSEWASWVQAAGSILALVVAIGLAVWSRWAEKRNLKVIEAKEAESRSHMARNARLNAERFIGLASSSIEGIEDALRFNPSKRDVLLRGTSAIEALAVSRTIDLNMLDIVSATTVLAARSICNQLDLLLQEERRSLANPPLADIRSYIPHFRERIVEIEAAWREKRLVS